MIKYFLFSQDYVKERNEVLNKVNKQMVLGTVAYNGEIMEFSNLSSTKNLARHADAIVVAEGDPNTMRYTMPSSARKTML